MLDSLFSRIPKWVKDLPESDGNKVLLMRIIAASQDRLDKPKKVIFAIQRFRSDRDAKAAVREYLNDEGWSCRTERDPESGMYLVEGQKDAYIITKGQLIRDEGLFTRVANLYGAEYDGWTVVLPPKR